LSLTLASGVVDLALASGVREFVVCGGSRNSPLVVALAAREGLPLISFPDERAAAFFALGRARRDRTPVAIVTTSGTAAAELLPAAIEAHYSGVPLVLITADRPRRHRGTGAPQAIEQAGLFGPYAEVSLDVESVTELRIGSWSRRAPLHVNVSFDEPLLEGELTAGCNYSGVVSAPQAPVASTVAPRVAEFVGGAERLLLLIGGLETADRGSVEAFAEALGAPVYAEPLSGLRESRRLEQVLLRAGDRILGRGAFDRVLRLGHVPTARFWRDLDESLDAIPVLSLSSLPFPGLAGGEHWQVDLPEILKEITPSPVPESRTDLYDLDRRLSARIDDLLQRFPRAEVPLFRALSEAIPEGARIFLGSSLPIREWDLACTRADRGFECIGNRGVNGIDGALSTFLGWCAPGRENWCIVGDLTALYDLSAPWVLSQLDPSCTIHIVIVNNGGGRIFARVPSLRAVENARRERLFENAHAIRFEHWAAMWGLDYEPWQAVPSDGRTGSPRLSPVSVIELLPSADESRAFWFEYDRLWEQA
jgi:2-succinyl-5-enolpyruvyl-6-hydroxy-3-cyclohexene-1-carboxylate synthase